MRHSFLALGLAVVCGQVVIAQDKPRKRSLRLMRRVKMGRARSSITTVRPRIKTAPPAPGP